MKVARTKAKTSKDQDGEYYPTISPFPTSSPFPSCIGPDCGNSKSFKGARADSMKTVKAPKVVKRHRTKKEKTTSR